MEVYIHLVPSELAAGYGNSHPQSRIHYHDLAAFEFLDTTHFSYTATGLDSFDE